MPSVSWCCHWLQDSYRQLSNESLNLLQQMGGEFTKDDAPVKFPYSQYERVYNAPLEDKVRFMNETMYQITRLFDGNMQTVTWDGTKLDHFRNIIYRQFLNLKSCVSPQRGSDKRLRRYFRKLNRNVLRKMNYSAQAWELIRKDTRRHLLRLAFMAPKKDSPSPVNS